MLDKEKVGRAIAQQRKVKGLTQKQLADLLNVSYQAVSRWEHGISLPSVDMIYDIAKTLETSVDFLLNGISEERKIISYMDSGLDVQRLVMIKNKIGNLISTDERLIHTMYGDPVFCKADISKMEEPVYVFANHVAGSKERFAMENGYDREICRDLIASAVNNLVRFGVKPFILQANIICGNNDGGQILIMAEIFKEFCENNGIMFAGFEVAAQAVNYHANEYKIGALVIGVIDKKNIITGSNITEGDVLIGLHTEGISSISYPFVKVMLDRRPDLASAKIDEQNLFVDEMMKSNATYIKAMSELIEQNFIHGAFGINRSLFNRRCYATMPKGLGASISASQIPVPTLFRYTELTLKEVREQIAYVPQEPYLYETTIAENISCGRCDIGHDEVVAAAKAANAHDFIVTLPDGYDTVLGERGNTLSGGERQRIAIARAIIRDTPIIVLDEATSALDNESETLVQESIRTLKGGRTIIMIAHRPSSIAAADEVIRLGA